jgi:hypothetical protein
MLDTGPVHVNLGMSVFLSFWAKQPTNVNKEI